MAIVALVTFARSSLADHYYVPSGSMEYTLLPGDRVVVDKTAYGFRLPLTNIDMFGAESPERGDIAVFDSPTDGLLLIKRVVAIGGDTIRLQDGHLTINGRRLSTPDDNGDQTERFGRHIAHLNLASGGGPDIDSFSVPDGYVLVLGDHRGNSHDGRYFGLLPETELRGRALAVYFRRGTGFTWSAL